MKGKLIVFEGTDGSGKATQAQMLCRHLAQEGIAYREIDFPRYGNPFAQPAALYLQGALGSHPGDVNAYAASTLFAVDRFASYKEDWGGFYEQGGVIVANRYTTSNAVHQASKLPDGEREAFVDWLFDLEYRRLELPKPDLVIYLDMPTEITERMMRRREAQTGTSADIHEQDEAYLRRCRENAREVVRRCGWPVICCARDDEPERWRTSTRRSGRSYGPIFEIVPGSRRKKGRAGHAPLSSAAAAAAVIAAAPAAAVAIPAPGAAAAAAAHQDHNEDDPQAGAVVVAVVKAHDCHLALCHCMQEIDSRGPDRPKFLMRSRKKPTAPPTKRDRAGR